MISVPYIAFMSTTSTEEMGIPLHVKNILILPDVQSEMTCCILSVRSSSLTSSIHECWICDWYDVKQPMHSRFIFEEINDGKMAIMTSLTFSNEPVKLVLSLSAILI